MNVNDLVNQFKSAALSVGEYLTPVLRESKFRETGVLTPEEFVAAGEHLVHNCPTWAWSKASDSSRTRDYLPPEKQFLVTRRVPCHQRCAQMDYNESLEKILALDEGGDGDEWVDTHHFDTQTNLAPKEIDEEETAAVECCALASSGKDGAAKAGDESDDEGGEAFDLDNYMEGGGGLEEEKDPNRYVAKPSVGGGGKQGAPSSSSAADEKGAGLVRTRTYDLHITYDKFYQVPRFWLVGYDENGRPLTVDQMKEDFSQEHADRTITLEQHPHLANLSLATIHPCRHAAVMKRLIEQFSENGKQLNVLDYLFIFLKFVQAVIPTVEYDYTRSIQF